MYANEKRKIMLIIAFTLLIIICVCKRFMSSKYTYAVDSTKDTSSVQKISNAKVIDIEDIINKNTKNIVNASEIYEKQEELEYITKYRKNNDLYVGVTKVSQEGRNGIQTITMKKNFDKDGNFLGEEQVSCVVTKSSINKIIDIGTKIYVEPKTEEIKATTTDGWDSSGSLTFNIQLNKPSGFTAEQFKEAMTDKKDVNKIFQNNSEYFYLIENEYNINGIFVAAIGIHESAWGTSRLAKNKFNLFGYGAYDSNPYNGAYSFSSYSESIDLIARVLVKYYINQPKTKIYDGQLASRKIL